MLRAVPPGPPAGRDGRSSSSRSSSWRSIVTTTTRDHLVGQVDDRLARGRRIAGRPRADPGRWRSRAATAAVGADRPVGLLRRHASTATGSSTTSAGSDFAGERPTPDVDLGPGRGQRRRRRPAVHRRRQGGRRPALPRRRPPVRRRRRSAITAQPLTDVDDTVNRLILVEVARRRRSSSPCSAP